MKKKIDMDTLSELFKQHYEKRIEALIPGETSLLNIFKYEQRNKLLKEHGLPEVKDLNAFNILKKKKK